MKKKGLIFAFIVLLAVLGYGGYQYCQRPDGSTRESREALLQENPKGSQWSIVQEQQIGEYILSGIVSNNKSGIAFFEAIGDGRYKLFSREWRDAEDIVTGGVPVGNVWYDVVWFNGAATSRAEITYTVESGKAETLVFDTRDGKIIYTPSPSQDYSMEVVYYDAEGNRYE